MKPLHQFSFLILLLCVCYPCYSLSFGDQLEIGNIIEDKLTDDRLMRDLDRDIRELERDTYSNGYIQPYAYPTPSKRKSFGKDTNGIERSIFLKSIEVDKSGRGKHFVEYTESDFPRYNAKTTYFISHIGYTIDCNTFEIRITGERFFDVNGRAILVNPQGNTQREKTTLKYPNSPFVKIPKAKNSFYKIYMKYVCH